jgi:hypothetical protein
LNTTLKRNRKVRFFFSLSPRALRLKIFELYALILNGTILGPVAKNVQVLTRAPRSDNGERVQPSEQDKKRAQEYVEFSRHPSQGSQSL